MVEAQAPAASLAAEAVPPESAVLLECDAQPIVREPRKLQEGVAPSGAPKDHQVFRMIQLQWTKLTDQLLIVQKTAGRKLIDPVLRRLLVEMAHAALPRMCGGKDDAIAMAHAGV